MIFGRPGSGKSTLAVQLAKELGLPVYHLDKYFYQENWVQRDYQAFLGDQQVIVNQDAWIIDGNNSSSFAVRWEKADLVIHLTLPLVYCYFRIIKRYLFSHKKFDDRAAGCTETIRYSLLKYSYFFEKRVTPIISELKKKYPEVIVKTVRNNQTLKQLVQELCSNHQASSSHDE